MKKVLGGLLFSALLLSSCSNSDDKHDKEDIELKVSDVTLTYAKTYQIEATSEYPISYTTEDEFHATVSKEGLIKAGKVGETNIKLTNGHDSKSIKVTIEATEDLYPMPIVDWGMSKSELIKKLGKPDYDSETIIRYDNYSKNAPKVMYQFDDGKLKASSIIVDISLLPDLVIYLIERYENYFEKDNIHYYGNAIEMADASFIIADQMLDLDYWMVTYFDADNLKTKSLNMSSSLEVIKKMASNHN